MATDYKVNSSVLVRWHDDWRSATVVGVRVEPSTGAKDYTVRPGCVKLRVGNLGCYQVPQELIRNTPPSPEEAISEEKRKEIWMRVSGGWTNATPE